MQNEMLPHFDEVQRRLRNLMTGPDDAKPASTPLGALSSPSRATNRSDKQNLEGNTYSRDQFLGYMRSNKLDKGFSRRHSSVTASLRHLSRYSTRKANNSFKGLASMTSSTADATSLTITQLPLELFPSHVT